MYIITRVTATRKQGEMVVLLPVCCTVPYVLYCCLRACAVACVLVLLCVELCNYTVSKYRLVLMLNGKPLSAKYCCRLLSLLHHACPYCLQDSLGCGTG